MKGSFRASLLALALAVSACGGGGGGGSLPSVPKATGQFGSAAFVFTIPSSGGAAASAKKYRPNTVPTNTQSVVVTGMNADGTPLNPAEQTTINLSACVPISGGLQCTGTIMLPIGVPLMLSIVAYDQANGGGTPIASAMVTLTVVSGMSSITASLGTAAQYYAEDFGGGLSLVTIDHSAGTISTQNVGSTNGISGSFTSLKNGFEKITVTSSTGGTPVGSIAYAKESPMGGLMFVQAGPSPDPTGSSTSDASWGGGTGTFGQCPTTGGSLMYNGTGILGGGYNVASGTAYTTGTATISASAVTFSGTNYTATGSVVGSASGNTPGCTNGVFGSATNGYVALGLQNVVIVGDPNPNALTDNNVGEIGFAAPSSSYSLSALASVSYDALNGGQYNSSGTLLAFESPAFAKPLGNDQLSACPYTDFENGQPATSNCTTITLQAQPLPGIITGIATTTSGSAPFVASWGIVNGKYMASVVSIGGTQGVNILLMQH